MPFRGRWVAVLVPLALLTAACGDDGSGDSDDADGVEGGGSGGGRVRRR
jgi:hypothetical protein